MSLVLNYKKNHFQSVNSDQINGDKNSLGITIKQNVDRAKIEEITYDRKYLSKVVKLLTDPHSLVERHVQAVKKIPVLYQYGFLLKDLVLVMKILNECADKSTELSDYDELFSPIIKLCGFSFYKEKASDKITYQQMAVESLSQLGYLMRLQKQEVQLQICQTLIDLHEGKKCTQDLPDFEKISLTFCKQLIEQSDVAETLVKVMNLVHEDGTLILATLDVLQCLTNNCPRICSNVLKVDAAKTVCLQLHDCDPLEQLFFVSIDVLWNLIQNGEKEDLTAQLNIETCLRILRDCFFKLLSLEHNKGLLELRNDILVLCCKLASMTKASKMIETGFLKALLLLATFQEIPCSHPLVQHLKFSKCDENFELKKIIINILISMSDDPASIPIFSKAKLLPALFTYLSVNNNDEKAQLGWTRAKFEELQLYSMNAISILGPYLIDDFMANHGTTRLLLFLESCLSKVCEDSQSDNPNIEGSNMSNIRHCIQAIRSMVSIESEVLSKEMVDQGIIDQLIEILSQYHKSERAEWIEIQTSILCILSVVCDNDIHRKDLFGKPGVAMLIEYLKMDISILPKRVGHKQLLLTALQCIWCSVIGTYHNEDYFLEEGGIFYLFNLLEKAPQNMHNLILGIIMDLCENDKSGAHIDAWVGKSHQTAAHQLCDMWRSEEKSMGACRDEKGVILDTSKPLMGTFQEKQEPLVLPASFPNASIVDVSENLRANIYGIFDKIGFIDLPGISTEDHVTLTIIENYLDFKNGEVWTEIVQELYNDNVELLSPDFEGLQAISHTIEHRVLNAMEIQKELLEAQKEQETIEENQFFAQIRERFKQKEKSLKHFQEYVERTSNHRRLKSAKERQNSAIEASRVQYDYQQYKGLANLHKTDIPNLNVTAFLSQTVDIENMKDICEKASRPDSEEPSDLLETNSLLNDEVKHKLFLSKSA